MKQDRRGVRVWRALACAAVVASGAWAGPGVGSAVATEAPGGSDAAVAILLFQFKPTPVEVKAGTQVTWTNNDDIDHTVTSGTPDSRDGRFNAKLSGKGKAFSFTFTQPGTYTFFCSRHKSMRGEIRVNP